MESTEPLEGSSRARERSARRLAIASMALLGIAGLALVLFTANSGASSQDTTRSASGALLGAALPDNAPRGGEPAPDFTVDKIGGGTFTLSEHVVTDGRPVLLNLWASWCIPCRVEMPDLDATSRNHPGVFFLGVAVQDSPSAAADFAREVGVTYQLAVDRDDRVSNEYPVLGLPATFLISGDGMVLATLFGQLTEERVNSELATFFGG